MYMLQIIYTFCFKKEHTFSILPLDYENVNYKTAMEGGGPMRKLSPWCKSVKKALIDSDMSVDDLARKIERTREYTSAVVNGRIYSEPAIKAISDVLNITDTSHL